MTILGTLKRVVGLVGLGHIAEGYTLASGGLEGMFTSSPGFAVGGFGLGLGCCVAAAVMRVLFQPWASVSIPVIGKFLGQLPLTPWFSPGVTSLPRRHLAMSPCILVVTAGQGVMLLSSG